MKLRIKDNSLRFRLTRSEVDALHQLGRVSAETAFPVNNETLSYTLATRKDGQPNATFSKGHLIVTLNELETVQWATTNEVGIAFDLYLSSGAFLAVLIEKDFSCLIARSGENESDHFPNPLSEKNYD
jgi:hypothetical protein